MAKPATSGFELSPQQKHAWTLLDGQPAVAQIAVLLEGALDIQRLKDSLHTLVGRHEILRTSFQRNTGMKFPFQVVSERTDFHWSERVLTSSKLDQDLISELFAARYEIDTSLMPTLYSDLAKLSADRHLLILSVPGLCADSGSLDRIVLDLRAAYASILSNEPEPLQYADYSEWQNNLLQSSDEEAIAANDYWKRHNYSAIPALRLPFEAKLPKDGALRRNVVPVTLAPEIVRNLESAEQRDTAGFLLAAWQVLASRLSGRDEIVIAEVSDGRHHEELANAVGLLSKALPRYGNYESDPSFTDAVAETKRARAEADGLQNYFPPEECALTIGFSVEDRTAPSPVDALHFSILTQQCTTFHFNIELRAIVRESVWSLEFVYDPAYFRHDVVEGYARQLQILLRSAFEQPLTGIASLKTMEETERQHILVDFNATTTDFPSDKCIHELFEEQTRRTPDRIALRFGEVEYTYAELNARANQIAHLLAKYGVKPNDPVGLCVERSAEMIIGLLGALKSGACYVPLVPDNPKARLAHQLKETATPVIITEVALLSNLPEFSGKIICLDRDSSLLENEPLENPQGSNSPSDIVYVIYTSGSTGTPKGVEVRHSNLVNYATFICRLLKLDTQVEGMQFATVSTISADLGNTCIFPSLISGGCLHVIDQETAMAANLFANHTIAHPIDVLKITPSHLATLLSVGEGKSILPRKYLILGGEALSWELVNRIQSLSNCTVINHYGPTEATVGCCTFNVQDEDVTAWSQVSVPIGRPIANDEIYILDRHLQPTAIGVPGELCIGGAGLAEGYHKQPQQTIERFIPHPFSKDPLERLYRTGDLARFLPDGNIEFLGRIDQQVKIRGFRVEPAEIENVLKQHPALRGSPAVVVPYEDKSGERRLAAYFVSTKPLSTEELREFLFDRLPNYMIPSVFIPLSTLPLTTNGKVDLRSLPSPEENQAKVERAFIPAASTVEEQLVAIWTEVLKVDQVSIDDNFFDLGGHSLFATQIISRIRNGFRVQMPLHSFLETPTIQGLAEKISECPPAESEEDEMARLLQELEELSDEEAERLLAEDNGSLNS